MLFILQYLVCHTHTPCNVQFSGYLGLAGCALYSPFPLLECIIAGKTEALHVCGL